MSATVRVWTIDLDEEPALASTLLACLSGEERVRASRFRTTEHRLRYIVAHGALRHILSVYVGVRPAQVSLATTATGKPFVPGSPLAFNLSHSEGLAICAVTPEGEIGADVECIRPIDDADSLVERFFAADERRHTRRSSREIEWPRSTASGPARKRSSKPPARASTASCSRSRSRPLSRPHNHG